MQLTPRLVVMLATPPLMWACNAVVGRLAIESIGPLWLNALRWVVAFALLLPLGWAALGTAAARAQIWERWKVLSILGLIGVGAYNALQYMALRTSTPLNVTLIASSSPVWTMLIGALAYGVIPTRLQLAGAVLSLSGVALVLSRGDLSETLETASWYLILRNRVEKPEDLAGFTVTFSRVPARLSETERSVAEELFRSLPACEAYLSNRSAYVRMDREGLLGMLADTTPNRGLAAHLLSRAHNPGGTRPCS